MHDGCQTLFTAVNKRHSCGPAGSSDLHTDLHCSCMACICFSTSLCHGCVCLEHILGAHAAQCQPDSPDSAMNVTLPWIVPGRGATTCSVYVPVCPGCTVTESLPPRQSRSLKILQMMTDMISMQEGDISCAACRLQQQGLHRGALDFGSTNTLKARRQHTGWLGPQGDCRTPHLCIRPTLLQL